MTLVLLIKEESELIIISTDYVYSIYHSDNYETIDIQLLTNNIEDYHFEKDYIISSTIYNQDQELSVNVTSISSNSDKIQFNNESYNQVIIKLELPFTSNDYLIEIEQAYLEIIYDNNQSLNISIGEINYIFYENYGSAISLSNLSATHEQYQGVNTLGGVNIELGNRTDNNINIINIDILSNSIHINKNYINEQEPCEFTSTVQECLNLDYSVFNAPLSDEPLNILLSKDHTINLYLPITYSEQYQFIYEFAIVIDYEINGVKETIIIDDFPYMNTSIFNSLGEEDVNVYRYQD